MRFTVEPWAPEYGTPAEADLAEPAAAPDVDVEVAAPDWHPLRPVSDPAGDVLFVDGVRRVDANVWIEEPDGLPALGLCATYAAGAVRCASRAEVVATAVERGLFTAAAGAGPVVTAYGEYGVRGTSGVTPEELWLGIQQRMGELEGRVAAGQSDVPLVVVDGPLSHRRHVPHAVGFVKTQQVQYLPPALRPILGELLPGQRTPLFLTTSTWSRYAWYLRLGPADGGPAAGIARCEVVADGSVATAGSLADLVTATLPRFASMAHKDPRAPQNLYPIGGLERALRRRLGDQGLLYRGLRVAATGRPALR
jgi:hypothetical protein